MEWFERGRSPEYVATLAIADAMPGHVTIDMALMVLNQARKELGGEALLTISGDVEAEVTAMKIMWSAFHSRDKHGSHVEVVASNVRR